MGRTGEEDESVVRRERRADRPWKDETAVMEREAN
jgi:hypothetical protein